MQRRRAGEHWGCRCTRRGDSGSWRRRPRELDEAWLVTADDGVDPVLITGHPGVHTRKIGLSTTDSKTNDTGLDPHRVLSAHHWTPSVSLESI